MPLDPRVRKFLEQIPNMDTASIVDLPIEDLRRAVDEMTKSMLAGEPPSVRHIEDRLIPGPAGSIPIRIYKPAAAEPLPVVVDFHGGGFWMGSIDMGDMLYRDQANAVGCIVVSVGYRLAPEHKFPAAPEDCYAATQWVMKNAASFGGDPGRIAVGGGSAGGNLAAVVCLMARDRGAAMPICQVLMWPVTDHSFDTPSYRENAEGYMCTKDSMANCWNHYLASQEDGQNCYASPLRAEDLSGLPPALVITAEYDPLRDEGEAYAARLREAGVPVTCTRYHGYIHGGLPLETTLKPYEEVHAYLRNAFARR